MLRRVVSMRSMVRMAVHVENAKQYNLLLAGRIIGMFEIDQLVIRGRTDMPSDLIDAILTTVHDTQPLHNIQAIPSGSSMHANHVAHRRAVARDPLHPRQRRAGRGAHQLRQDALLRAAAGSGAVGGALRQAAARACSGAGARAGGAHLGRSVARAAAVSPQGARPHPHYAYIHVPRVYSEKGNELGEKSDKPEVDEKHADAAWWCFNDFVIASCEGFEEVAAFQKFWKKPCILAYVRRDINNRVGMEINDTSVDVREVIGEEKHNEAIGLQPDEEVPGTVLALNCEFVTVSRDEADVFGHGTWQIVVPARIALARVSVTRRYGRLKGVALMDDYVVVREPVVDYLTRFSGLSEGDLDATRSPHKVSSLKTVYKRLRCLVDAGCIFVGHGLKSDFRMINFVVPPEQVIDTVTLIRVKNKRLLGLRFLSNALLGGDIQSETHDSIEDSDAALRLYDVYLRLKAGEDGEDRFEQTLKELYAYGYAHGWKADPKEPFVLPQ
ncbi:Ribonuclease H [Gracilaria domingensis]|nr:Ribonuclease H [Gracilaria domingensis]